MELRDDGLLYLAEEILGQGNIQAATVIVTDLGTINEDTCIRTMTGRGVLRVNPQSPEIPT